MSEYDDDWIDDEVDDDGDDDKSECLICPSCRNEVHEDAQQCPHCGDWITPVYPEPGVKKWVWRIAAILAILSMVLIAIS